MQTPDLTTLCHTDKTELHKFIDSAEAIYNKILRINCCYRYDMDNFLLKMDKFGLYFNKYYRELDYINSVRAGQFKIAIAAVYKYAIEIAKYILVKLVDKDNTENESAIIAYTLLTEPQTVISDHLSDKYRDLILQIVRLQTRWTFLQGQPLSDIDE